MSSNDASFQFNAWSQNNKLNSVENLVKQTTIYSFSKWRQMPQSKCKAYDLLSMQITEEGFMHVVSGIQAYNTLGVWERECNS